MKYGVIQGISLCMWNIAHAVALWYTTILVERKQATFENSIRSYQIFSLTVPSITELRSLIPMAMSAIEMLNPAFNMLDRQIFCIRPFTLFQINFDFFSMMDEAKTSVKMGFSWRLFC
jgi:hypothetical protein